MRTFLTVCFSGVVLGLNLPGCVAEHASALDESTSELEVAAQQPANPSDPFGACEVGNTLNASFPFPGSCSQGGGCNGWASVDCVVPDSGGPCEHGTFWEWCFHECETDSDCPQPETGDVAARCMVGSCHLPCSEGDACPQGMACFSPSVVGGWTSLYSSVCAQYFELSDFTVPPLVP